MIREFCSNLVETKILNGVNKQIEIIEKQREEEAKRIKEREDQRKKDLLAMKTISFYKFSSLVKRTKRLKAVKRKRSKGLRSRSVTGKVMERGEHVNKTYHLKSILRERTKLRQLRLKCKFCPER